MAHAFVVLDICNRFEASGLEMLGFPHGVALELLVIQFTKLKNTNRSVMLSR